MEHKTRDAEEQGSIGKLEEIEKRRVEFLVLTVAQAGRVAG